MITMNNIDLDEFENNLGGYAANQVMLLVNNLGADQIAGIGNNMAQTRGIMGEVIAGMRNLEIKLMWKF